ncbi:MAG: hypothetical protein FOGNACKC_02890 [Anaerolineae bacterium]|nr:hypothetical protein [Anaerolineae bacterium]
MTDTNGSKIVKAGARTYFFDLKQIENGNPYLTITESHFKGEDQERERPRIIVFPDHAREFLAATQKMIGKLVQ